MSSNGVYSVLKRHGMNRLPPGSPKRSPSTFTRYEKVVPGHQAQIDVKFLFFNVTWLNTFNTIFYGITLRSHWAW